MNKIGQKSRTGTRGAAHLKAAVYLRMSTEHQQYSVENQMAAIQAYADRNGMKINKIYTDGARSGLHLRGRAELQRLLADTQLGTKEYTEILVLDVTRWGRFQDPDESGHYEFMCRKAGYRLHYVNESFSNDGSVQSSLLKNVKRTMAGSYSLELSGKVFAGQSRLAKLGFKQGGPAGYGLRRQLISEDGQRKFLLKNGDRKSLQTDRVIFVPGPPEEVKIVREIYRLFVDKKFGERKIATLLNKRGVPSSTVRPWTQNKVTEVLTNEKYIGTNVYNRRSCKLRTQTVYNPRSEWLRVESAFEGIVDTKYFVAAARRREERMNTRTDKGMLAGLRKLLADHGTISYRLINQTPGLPRATTYLNRFGSLAAACAKVGFSPGRSQKWVTVNRDVREIRAQLAKRISDKLRFDGATAIASKDSSSILINDEVRVSIVMAKCKPKGKKYRRWYVRCNPRTCDFTLIARLDAKNEALVDYYLFPSLDLHEEKFTLFEENERVLDAYRLTDIDLLYALTSRTAVTEL